MKSLVKEKSKALQPPKEECCPQAPVEPVVEAKIAQCCAKVSKAIAGCHD